MEETRRSGAEHAVAAAELELARQRRQPRERRVIPRVVGDGMARARESLEVRDSESVPPAHVCPGNRDLDRDPAA